MLPARRAVPFVLAALCLSSPPPASRASADPGAPAPAASPTGEDTALCPVDCLAALTELNETGKLVPEAVFPGVRLNGLTEEGCHGVRLAGGKRFVAIDLGASGFEGSISEQGKDGTFSGPLSFRMMGFLYAELPFSIAEQTLPAGAWAVEAFNTTLRLVGNHETATRYDPAQRKEVPLPKTVKLELKVPIPASILGADATETPHYSIALDGTRIVLRAQDNSWVVTPIAMIAGVVLAVVGYGMTIESPVARLAYRSRLPDLREEAAGKWAIAVVDEKGYRELRARSF